MNKGRFKSQALLNEQAVLSCMVYVDLNPIRAGVSDSLDESAFTSIEQRIKHFALSHKTSQPSVQSDNNTREKPASLLKLADFVGGQQKDGIPFSFRDYLELADWTGRAVREDKTGHISDNEPKILEKLGVETDIWLKMIHQYTERSYSHLGNEDELKSVCQSTGQKWLAGIRHCRLLFH